MNEWTDDANQFLIIAYYVQLHLDKKKVEGYFTCFLSLLEKPNNRKNSKWLMDASK